MFTSKCSTSLIPFMLAATLGFVSTGCQAGLPNQPARETSPAREFVQQIPSLALDGGCVRIQRGVNREVADTRISEGSQHENYGIDPTARTGAADTAEHRTLLGFDLRDVPPGATIVRATMLLLRRTGGRANISVHRITKPWSEQEATWSSFGNAYDSSAVSTLQLSDDSEKGPVSFDVTNLVRGWSAGEYPAEGVMVKDSEGDSAFATSESFRVEDHPRLEVCYAGADFANHFAKDYTAHAPSH